MTTTPNQEINNDASKNEKPPARPSRGRVLAWITLLSLAVLLTYCGFFAGRISFTEEIQLEDGSRIKAHRLMRATGFGEIGGPGGWEPKYSSLVIQAAQLDSVPTKWETDLSVLPILLDRDSKTREWFLVARIHTCDAWIPLGRPRMPYGEWRYRNSQWQLIPLSDGLIGRSANLFTSMSIGGEADLITLSVKSDRDARAARSYQMVDPKSAEESACQHMYPQQTNGK